MYTPYMVPDAVKLETAQICHVVAMPYPGRGHVNPMMNLCIMLASRKPDILVSIVVTEEWHSFIKSEPKPNNVQFSTIPNVIPSELEKAKNFSGFVLAVRTKMEDPFEKLLDRLEPPVTAIIADSTLSWIIALGSRKNIPVASLWPMSATKLSLLYHFDILKEKGHFPIELSEIGDEVVDYIPGVSPSQIRDFPTICYGEDLKFLTGALKLVELISKAQYLILTTAYELEPEAVDALRSKYQIPVYPVGPSIPFFKLPNNPLPYNYSLAHDNVPQYLQWLNSQPNDTVLYISYGSYLSVSNAQMDEIVAGIKNSGVTYIWVARGEASKLKETLGDDHKGLVVPWVDQLRVLCHSSIGGFFSHCGWNSSLESAFSGVPVLTYPIFWDQVPNSKKIVEDWRIGWRVRKKMGLENFVSREEIADLVRRFMDGENEEVMEMRKRAKGLKEACQKAIAQGGSTETNLDAFIENIRKSFNY